MRRLPERAAARGFVGTDGVGPHGSLFGPALWFDRTSAARSRSQERGDDRVRLNSVVWATLCTLALASLACVGCSGSGTESASQQPSEQAGHGTASSPARPGSSGAQRAAKASTSARGQEKSAREKSGESARAERIPLPPLELSSDEVSAGWVQLFDGVSLFGWRAVDGRPWTVQDGCLVSPAGGVSRLLTTTPFADFELRLQTRTAPGSHAALLVRCTPQRPTQPNVDCCRLELPEGQPATSGSGVSSDQKGQADTSQGGSSSGPWHAVVVRVVGRRVSLTVDGKNVAEQSVPEKESLRCGFLGLEASGAGVAFRRVRLKPLGLQSLFNGKDLSGWRVVPGSQSRFVVQDGAIHVENGPGFLETEGQWADFVLQFEARTNGKELNSGVFFRAMPGTAEAPSNGYEVQIHNGFEGQDRTRPSNAGTGAIFRRTTARWVVADDHQWFTVTLVAAGPHFSVWVNGLQVTDWTDTRPKHENPRRGLRLAAGHLSLQGHDPTTNLDFRNLRLAPLPVVPGW